MPTFKFKFPNIVILFATAAAIGLESMLTINLQLIITQASVPQLDFLLWQLYIVIFDLVELLLKASFEPLLAFYLVL